MMKSFLERILLLTLFTLSTAIFAMPARAAYIVTGDVSPADPASWTRNTDTYIGNSTDGSLTINGGTNLVSNYIDIGHPGALGEVIIEGTGSTWTSYAHLTVGANGNGTMKLTNGGSVSNYFGFIGEGNDSTGVVTIDGAGSLWTNKSDLYVGDMGRGRLNITAGGQVINNSVT